MAGARGGGKGNPASRHRRIDRHRLADGRRQGAAAGDGAAIDAVLAPAVRADRGQRLRLPPDRPAAPPRVAGRAGAGPRRIRGARAASARGVRAARREAPRRPSRGRRGARRRIPTGSTGSRARSAARSACGPSRASHFGRLCRKLLKPSPARCAASPQIAEHAPFCSPGCKDRDLLKWLGEGYRIPGPAGRVPDRVDSEEGEG